MNFLSKINIQKVIVLAGIAVSVFIVSIFILIFGIFSLLEVNGEKWEDAVENYAYEDQGFFSNTEETFSIVKNPLKFWAVFPKSIIMNSTIFIVLLALVGILLIKLWAYIGIHKDNIAMYTQAGKYQRDFKDTHGSAHFADDEDIKKAVESKELSISDGAILGCLEKVDITDIVDVKKCITLGYEIWGNKHMLAMGSSGSGKSFSFVRPLIINVLNSFYEYKPSFVVTDPKGELYNTLAGYLIHRGINVKVFNLLNTKNSDKFNPLAYITSEDDLEIIANTIIMNTELDNDKGGDVFWKQCEMSLLKAVIAYLNKYYPLECNLVRVYDILNMSSIEEIDAMFVNISDIEPAKRYYYTYSKAPEHLRSNILLGLCARLSIVANNDIRDVLEEDEIDFYSLKDEPTAIFVIIPDQHNTFQFVTALFFSVMGIKLSPYVDRAKKGSAVAEREVYTIIDEARNIGAIPNFVKWITTFRSRKINLIPIFQDINQIKELYGEHEWETLYGNCDTKVILAAGDESTSDYISKRLGISSVRVQSKMKKSGIFRMNEDERVTHADQKRQLMNPDEISDLPKERVLVLRQKCKPMKLYKVPWVAMKEDYELAMEHAINIEDYNDESNLYIESDTSGKKYYFGVDTETFTPETIEVSETEKKQTEVSKVNRSSSNHKVSNDAF